jgi:hypothetical protein
MGLTGSLVLRNKLARADQRSVVLTALELLLVISCILQDAGFPSMASSVGSLTFPTFYPTAIILSTYMLAVFSVADPSHPNGGSTQFPYLVQKACGRVV